MSSERSVTRRDALRIGAATATVIGGLHLVTTPASADEGQRGQSGQQGQDPAFSVAAQIEGCPDASKNILDVQLPEIRIDARDMTTGQDVSYRTYVPGETHIGEATFVSGFTEAGSAQLRAWVDAWGSGKQDLRRIAVSLVDPRGVPSRGWELFDCFPTAWSGVNFDTSSSVQTETIRVKVGRIEFKV